MGEIIDKTKGKIKQAAGALAGNDKLKAEGEIDELKGAGLIEPSLPAGFSVPVPSDDPALRDDEDPLEPGDLDLGLAPPAGRSEE